MVKFHFIARNGEETLPLQIDMAYRPGKQNQRARRLAIGELLAALEVESATIDASGDDQVSVTTPKGTWVIGEGGMQPERRRGI